VKDLLLFFSGPPENTTLKTLTHAACLKEILDRLSRLRADSPRRWGKMNAHQMICHLNDSFHVAMGQKTVSMAPPAIISRRMMKQLALYFPMQWPHGVPTRPEIDQEISGTAPADFQADLQMVIATTEEFVRVPRTFTFGTHPMFDKMTEADWMRWGYLHCDHHLRQFGH
jgi:hypothetical protein